MDGNHTAWYSLKGGDNGLYVLNSILSKIYEGEIDRTKRKIEKYTIIVSGFSIFSSVTNKEKLLKILLNSYREQHAQST